jgi:tetratricopeptide (TPR) repeat protein
LRRVLLLLILVGRRTMAYESIPDYLRKLRSQRNETQIEQSHTFTLSKASYPKTTGKIEDFKRKLSILGELWDAGSKSNLAVSPFYPFLDIIAHYWDGPIEALLKWARVSPLHHTLFEGHFSHNEAYREEEILFYGPCMIWENVSLLDEVVRLLEIVLQGKDPLILLFPSMGDYSYGSLKVIDALSAKPIAASLWILAYDLPGNPEESLEMEEKKKHELEKGFLSLMSHRVEEQKPSLYKIYEAARSQFMFCCFKDAVLLSSLFLKHLAMESDQYEPVLKLDLEFLLGMSLYGIQEIGQSLEHLKRIEDPQKVAIPEKKYFEFYTKQSEIYLFRGSYEMASKAVYQAKKYQREDNIKEEYQVLFLQFSNPQLFNGEEVTRQFSILEKYLGWLLEKGFYLRYLHLTLRPDVLSNFARLYGKEEVEGVIRRAIKLAQKLQHAFFESEGWAALGNFLGFEKDLASSLRYYKKGLRIREEKLGGSFLPQILNGLGFSCMVNGDFLKAHNYFQRALNLLFKQKNHLEVVMTLINLGYTTLYGHQFKLALQYFQSAYQLSRQLQTVDIPYHSRREIFLFVSYLYYFNNNYGKSSEFFHLALHEVFDQRPHVLSLQNALMCLEVSGPLPDFRKDAFAKQFWKLADRDPVQVHYATMSLQLLSLNDKESLGLDGELWWKNNQALIKKYQYPSLKGYGTGTFSRWAKKGFPLDSLILKKDSSQLKETLIFREAQQARMVLNLEKRVQEISLINQIHQRILHNKSIEAFLLQVKDLIFRNFVCDQIQVYLDPRHFTPHSLEILTSLEELEPWIRNIFYQKGDRKKVFLLSPHPDLPRKIASFGFFPLPP